MTEEKPSEPVEFIILSFGLLIIFLLISKILFESISVLIYFFSTSSADNVSNLIADVITSVGGTPGNVKTFIEKPKDYEYLVDFKDKMIFVEIYDHKNKVLSLLDLDEFLIKSRSSSAVSFKSEDFSNLENLIIQKEKEIKIEKVR